MYILRHGETVWNVEGRMQGWQDSPLTHRGREQALLQGRILLAAVPQTLPVFCSPSGRAQETARIALPDRTITIDDRLAEVGMGQWQGLTLEDIEARWPGALDEQHPILWKFSAPGGETLDAMQRRVRSFCLDRGQEAIAITHGVTSQLLRGEILGLDLDEIGDLEDAQGVVYRADATASVTLDLEGKDL